MLLCVFSGVAAPLCSQDLTPRAYVITPVGAEAVTLSTSFSSGQILLDPTSPLEGTKGSFQASAIAYYVSFDFMGRSANLNVALPYARGDFEGTLAGSSIQAYRSGLGDARVRLAVNLAGAPAMSIGDYRNWKEKRLLGASLTVTVPSGQYDSARAINIGTNRWSVKPEIGFSRRWRHWVIDAYGGVWFFAGNNAYYPGSNSRSQLPIGAVESHLGYYLKPRLWLSLDVNFWNGGRSRVGGVENDDRERDSRVGGTVSVPINQRLAFKLSYSGGAYVTVGGAYRTLSAGWQYSWIPHPR